MTANKSKPIYIRTGFRRVYSKPLSPVVLKEHGRAYRERGPGKVDRSVGGSTTR